MEIKVGLVKGRHEMPVDEYVFDQIEDVLDFEAMCGASFYYFLGLKDRGVTRVHLYVTGLTAALIECINTCVTISMPLTFWHYDTSSGEYKQQKFVHPEAKCAVCSYVYGTDE